MTELLTSREDLTENTCFLSRSDVRVAIISSPDINNETTNALLREIDALPIFTAEDMPGVAQVPVPSIKVDECYNALIGLTSYVLANFRQPDYWSQGGRPVVKDAREVLAKYDSPDSSTNQRESGK